MIRTALGYTKNNLEILTPPYVHKTVSYPRKQNRLAKKVTSPLEKEPPIRNNTFNSDDLSILGDTINADEKETATATQFTLQSISEIIMLRLKENNTAIITEIKSTIQSEINKAINTLKEEIEQKTDILNKQNELRKKEIEKVSIKIEYLTEENEKLKKEILDMKNSKDTSNVTCTETNSKKIVLYGLAEYYKEPELELHNRISELFYNTMNVDLTGYIENTYRIGKMRWLHTIAVACLLHVVVPAEYLLPGDVVPNHYHLQYTFDIDPTTNFSYFAVVDIFSMWTIGHRKQGWRARLARCTAGCELRAHLAA
ncbi:hypothetical protein HF086_000384 [Spodoptera exigua]|uniref:Uncharacterized protein n=1 Tax=Spodoptera exigua TaxID=7107 RepID=A0A922MAP9_SPOEX|nr:hypothetical protein HF086_000384 [Spodoptera exigua]